MNRAKTQSIECSNLLREAVLAGDVEAVRTVLSQNNVGQATTAGQLTCLWESIRANNFEIAELLIAKGADVNQKLGLGEGYRKQSSLLLELAVWSDQSKATRLGRLLIKGNKNNSDNKLGSGGGASVNVRGGFMQDNVLNLAIRFGNLHFAEMLLQEGARLYGQKNTSLPGLIAAALSPKPTKALELVLKHEQIKKDCVKRKGFFSGNALHALCENCVESPRAAELLLNEGVSMTDYDEFGYSPLHRAVERGKRKLAALFIKRGADVDHKTSGMDVDTKKRQLDDQKKANSSSKPLTPLVLAVKKCDLAMVRFLLESEACIRVIVTHSDPIIMPEGFCSSPAVSCNPAAIEQPYQKMLSNFHDSSQNSLDKVLVEEIRKSGIIVPKSEQIFDLAEYFSKIDRNLVAVPLQPMNKIVLKELAKLKFEKSLQNFSMPITLCQKHTDAITPRSETVQFFQECINELRSMEATKFYGNYSYFSVLRALQNRRQLAEFTENIGFVSGFNQFDYIGLFKIYGPDLDYIFGDALKKRDYVQRLYPLINGQLPKDILYRVSQFSRLSKTYAR